MVSRKTSHQVGTGWRTGTSLRSLVALLALPFLMVWVPPEAVVAQLTSQGLRQGPGQGQRVRVFLDCQSRNCDTNHFRTEIPWVNWVRERTDSDIHVIFTSAAVGGGGTRYTFDFIGLNRMEGRNDQLTYTEAGTDVRAETMDGLAQTFGLGLLRYAVEAGQGNELSLRFSGNRLGFANGCSAGDATCFEDEAAAPGGPDAFVDPWNAWTFRLGLSGNMDIQERRDEKRMNPTFSANRVTDDWKVDVSFWSNLRRQKIELSDGRVVRNDQDSWRLAALMVYSISDHLSVGLDTRAFNSISQNQRSRMALSPAVEWNYYPYAEANRRQLITHYGAGIERSDYFETTLFGVDDELRPTHRFALQYRVREPWGNAGVGFDASQYLHDLDLYSFGLSGEVSYRISRGLELSLSGDAGRVNDQIHVPRGSYSDEDILLGRVNLPTGYRYQASVGFGYRWGSTLTNVVNNRFPRSIR
jgi:hypothetical protein